MKVSEAVKKSGDLWRYELKGPLKKAYYAYNEKYLNEQADIVRMIACTKHGRLFQKD